MCRLSRYRSRASGFATPNFAHGGRVTRDGRRAGPDQGAHLRSMDGCGVTGNGRGVTGDGRGGNVDRRCLFAHAGCRLE